jgi:hypothetical protein
MLSWASIIYGAALSAAVAGVALAALARPRQPTVIFTGVLATAAGPLAWNAILRATHASQFFTDAPLRLLPASWQDTGSGVFALAATAGTPRRRAASHRTGSTHDRAGRAVWPGRVPGRRLPVLTNRRRGGTGHGCPAEPGRPAWEERSLSWRSCSRSRCDHLARSRPPGTHPWGVCESCIRGPPPWTWRSSERGMFTLRGGPHLKSHDPETTSLETMPQRLITQRCRVEPLLAVRPGRAGAGR